MSVLQICLLSVIGLFAILSVVFMVLFLKELKDVENESEEVEVKSIFSSENYTNEIEKNNESVDDMLAKLDEQAEETSAEEPVEEVKEEVVEETAVENEPVEEEVVEENTEQTPAEEQVEEVNEEVVENAVETEAEGPVEEVREEVVEETAEEIVETEEVSENTEETSVEETETAETIKVGSILDYKERLEDVMKNKTKIEKDLAKLQRAILNYERTKRRKNRNQKMLDRRASELTNLNLVMYSVTDIKNVDEDKKQKQEELTSHIAELKASIQDADEFIESNKEKNEHDIKMAKFLMRERARYDEEIAALEKLISNTESNNELNTDANVDSSDDATAVNM